MDIQPVAEGGGMLLRDSLRRRGSEARNPRAVLACAYLFRLLARLTGRFLTQCQ